MYYMYPVKELGRRKGRTVTFVVAVAALVAILVVLTTVMDAYSAAIYQPFQSVEADIIAQKSGAENGGAPTAAIRLAFGKGAFDQSEMDRIAAVPHVTAVSPSLVLWYFDKGRFTSIEGVDLTSVLGEKMSSWINAGRFLEPDDVDKVVVEKHFAKFYGLKPGDSLKLGDATFEIVGTVAAQGESQVSSQNVYMDLGRAQQLLGVQGYSHLYLKLDSLSSEETVRSQINAIDTRVITVSGSSIATSFSNVMKIYNWFRFAGSLAVAAIVALVLFQVGGAALMERRRDIGIMQSVGWAGKDIRNEILLEIVLQTVMGCILGLAVSVLAVVVIGSIRIQVSMPGNLANDMSTISAPLTISPSLVALFAALAVVTSATVSLFLVRRVSMMKPLANLESV
ncbi:MAG: ABC transporter permease [Chloroflexi bacterium]|nr:ABC transporter permease [Chloroflexota bacterium]